MFLLTGIIVFVHVEKYSDSLLFLTIFVNVIKRVNVVTTLYLRLFLTESNTKHLIIFFCVFF